MSAATLDEFCRHLMDAGSPNGSLQPGDVAREFVHFFGLSPSPSFDELTAILEGAGIRIVVCPDMPGGLRGYHTGTSDGSYEIRIDGSEWDGAQEHTVLHETYEIVRERVRDIYSHIETIGGRGLCRLADRFAAAVLMQPYCFSLFAETSGLDVIALQKGYGRAYSSVTMRLAEVMRDQPLMAVLYERGEKEEHHFRTTAPVANFRASTVARTPGFGVRHCRALCGTRGGMPRWGTRLPPGSLAEGVALTGRADFAEVEPPSGDVAVAARPVHRHGRVVKIVVVAVPYHDRSVIWRQFVDPAFDSARRMALAEGPW